jgi:CrcB protein
MLKILLVGAGGFVGSICRYVLSGMVYQIVPPRVSLPYGTLLVNVLGCILIGFLSGLTETRQLFNPETRVLVFIGLLGAFTTYSTFGYETFALARDGQYVTAISNISLHLCLGLGAVWLGHSLSKLV